MATTFLLPGKTKEETEAALAKMPGLKKLVDGGIEILKGENEEFVNGQSIAAHALRKWNAPDWAVRSAAYQEYVSMEAGRMAGERAEIALSQIAGTTLTALATLGNVTALTTNSLRLLIQKTDRNNRRLTKAVDTLLAVELVSLRGEVNSLKKQLDSQSTSSSGSTPSPVTPPPTLLVSGSASGLNMGLVSGYPSDKRFRIFIELPSGSPSAVVTAQGSILNTVKFGTPRIKAPAAMMQPMGYYLGLGIFPPDGVLEVAPAEPSPSTGLNDAQGFDIMLKKDHKWIPGEICFLDVVLTD